MLYSTIKTIKLKINRDSNIKSINQKKKSEVQAWKVVKMKTCGHQTPWKGTREGISVQLCLSFDSSDGVLLFSKKGGGGGGGGGGGLKTVAAGFVTLPLT